MVTASPMASAPRTPPEDVDSMELEELLVVRAKISSALATPLTELVLENREALAEDGVYATAIEPTESESLAEIDRFCDAMIAIAAEIKQVAAGTWSVEESPLRHAPHTLADLVGQWGRSYPRTVGAFPAGVDPDKYWPPVGRIENAHGDRNLVCSCPPPEAFAARRTAWCSATSDVYFSGIDQSAKSVSVAPSCR